MKLFLSLPLLLIMSCQGPSQRPKEIPQKENDSTSVVAIPTYNCPFKKIVSTNENVTMEEGITHHIDLMLGLGLPVKLAQLDLKASDSIVLNQQLRQTNYRTSFYADSTMNKYNMLITTVCSQLEAIETSNAFNSEEKRNEIKKVLAATGEYLHQLLINSIPRSNIQQIEAQVINSRIKGYQGSSPTSSPTSSPAPAPSPASDPIPEGAQRITKNLVFGSGNNFICNPDTPGSGFSYKLVNGIRCQCVPLSTLALARSQRGYDAVGWDTVIDMCLPEGAKIIPASIRLIPPQLNNITIVDHIVSSERNVIIKGYSADHNNRAIRATIQVDYTQ